MSFETLNAEVDRQILSLQRHPWKYFPWWTGQRWHWIYACEACGLKYEPQRHKQICLGVIGELMLAKEKVPARWANNFHERVHVGRRAWKKKQPR